MLSIILRYAAGVTTILSLLSFLGGMFVWLQSQKREKSIVDTIKGEGIVDVTTVLKVLKQFKTDEARLSALQHVLGYSKDRASDVLDKVKPNVDVGRFSLVSQKQLQRRLVGTGIVLVLLAGLSVAFGGYRVEGSQPPPVSSVSEYVAYTGKVRDAKSVKPIGNASVTITEDRDAPKRFTTDSEGVFFARLSKDTQTMLLEVKADGFKDYSRRGPTVRTGSEDIFLEPLPSPQSSTPQSRVPQQSSRTSTPHESSEGKSHEVPTKPAEYSGGNHLNTHSPGPLTSNSDAPVKHIIPTPSGKPELEQLRTLHGVSLIKPEDADRPMQEMPLSSYGFIDSMGLTTRPQTENYRHILSSAVTWSFEVHRLSDGGFDVVGFVGSEIFEHLRAGINSGEKITIYSAKWSNAPNLVSVPTVALSCSTNRMIGLNEPPQVVWALDCTSAKSIRLEPR